MEKNPANVKKGKAAKSKGKRGERMFRDFLKDYGFNAARGCQFHGGEDSPDVICEDLSDFHFEVKFMDQINIIKAWDQAKADCGKEQVPIVAYRKTGRPQWFIVLDGNDWITAVCQLPILANFRKAREGLIVKETLAKIRKLPGGEEVVQKYLTMIAQRAITTVEEKAACF